MIKVITICTFSVSESESDAVCGHYPDMANPQAHQSRSESYYLF